VNQSRKPKKQAGPAFINIKEYGRSRLLHDMLTTVKNRAKTSPNYIILVLDDDTAKIMTRFCDIFDLMEHGSVYQIERLKLFRKRYPMSDALYFVKPTLESIKKIITDFPLEDPLDYDQYGDVHLCFSNPVPNEYIELLNKQEKLVKKVKTFFEVNIDF
jgi:syntaxin-binding protein 1